MAIPEKIKKKFKIPSLIVEIKLKDCNAYLGWMIGAIVEKNFKKSELRKMNNKEFERALAKVLKENKPKTQR